MMTYKEFCLLAQELLEKKCKDGTRVHLSGQYKNNGGFQEALCVLEEGSNVSPVLYLRKYYEAFASGMSMDEAVEKLLAEYEKKRCAVFLDGKGYGDFEEMKSKIVCKLVNYERNKGLLEQAPHRRYLDLAVVYYFLIEDPVIGRGTAVIQNNLLEAWKVTEEALYEAARENTERILGAEIRPIGEVIKELFQNDLLRYLEEKPDEGEFQNEQVEAVVESMMGGFHLDEPKEMYVYSNHSKYCGAAVLLDERGLEEFSEEQGSFFIVPSSIHEVILIPERVIPVGGELKALLRDINTQMEDGTEYLSDRIYYYDRERKCVEVRA